MAATVSGSSMAITYRRAVAADYPALVRIAADSARDNPEATARGHGFLTGHFDTRKFAEFNADLGILVADVGGEIAGFLCATTRRSAVHAPIVQAMLDACRQARLDGRSLDAFELFNYGPVCIAPKWQGRGLLKGLFGALKRELKGRFEVGVLFIDADNPHSLQAHERGLGMTRAGGFEFNGRIYHLLAFRCDG
ncbi:MAG: GNAT family N-acetyltransferase [Acetobacteraceae bacterium]